MSILGPTRFHNGVSVDIGRLTAIDAVLISHNHYDHLNKDSIRRLKDKAKEFVVPLGVGAQLVAWGVPREAIVELDWWQDHETKTGLKITATPSQHFSGRGLSDRDRTLWVSYAIRGPHHRIFFSGDSGYFDGFKQIGERFGPFDMTFIECGAYNEKWRHIHMFPEDTVRAHLDLRGDILHPIHWGTFNLSLHPWYEPMERVARAAGAAGVRLAMPVAGGTTVVGGDVPDRLWWREAMPKTGNLKPKPNTSPLEENK